MNRPKPQHLYLLFISLLLSIPINAQTSRFTTNPIDIPPAMETSSGMLTIDSEIDTYSATYLPNVEYVNRSGRSLSLQLLLPKSNDENTKPRPLIVYVQGSAWLPQNLYTALPQLADFAHHGYAVASVEYRPSNEAIAPAQIQDVLSAIRFLRASAQEYNLDVDNVGIWGDSSGGHLAVMAAVANNKKNFITSDNADQSMALKAVVDFYGPSDFREMDKHPSRVKHDAANSPESRVVGGPIQDSQYTERVALYNPITYISKDNKLPPFLIMHGDEDPLVPFNQSVILYDALVNAEQQALFYKVKGAGHGTKFWTPQTLTIVKEFFDTHLK